MTSQINVTVRLPFSDDVNLLVPTEIPVSDLIVIVQNIVPNVAPGNSHCIMYRGRVLDDEQTLSQLTIPNNAVLQMMPIRHPLLRRSRLDGTQAPESDWGEALNDHEHGDELHHVHEHIHTNVLISHIGFRNRRAQYSDVRDMLVSLFHSLGFSTHGINSAANIAAALLISFDSGVERGSPSRAILEGAWNVVQTTQERMTAPETTVTVNSGQSQAHNTNQGNPSASGPSASISPAPQAGSSSPWSRRVAPPAETASAGSRNTPVLESLSALPETSLPEGHEPGEHVSAASELPRISVLPVIPPRHRQSEGDLIASARIAELLVPALRELLTNLDYRLGNAPSFVDLVQGESTQDISQLVELTGATAGAMTAVATLLSTIHSGEDEEDGSRNSGSRPGSSSERRPESPTSGDLESDMNLSSLHHPDGQNGQHSRHTHTGTHPTDSTIGMQVGSQAATATYRTGRARNTSNGSDDELLYGIPPIRDVDEETEEENYGAYYELNAGFLVRLIAYYFYSLIETDSPDEVRPDDNYGSATDVLGGIYGNDGCEEPLNPFLRILYFIMDMLTPLEFHQVCRGDFSPIAHRRLEVWEVITDELSEVANYSVEPHGIEELFLYSICEKFHKFIHMVDAQNSHNEGTSHPSDAEEICHRIIPHIHRITMNLVDAFIGELGDEDFDVKLRNWFSDAFGGVIYAVSVARGLVWDSVVVSFRRACHEVGIAVVGGQFSIIFPLIFNLFLNRAKTVYDRLSSSIAGAQILDIREDNRRNAGEGEDEFDHSSCGPGCRGRQIQESRENQRSFQTNPQEFRGADSDLDIPDLVSDTQESSDGEATASLRGGENKNTPWGVSSRVAPGRTESRAIRTPMDVDDDVEFDDQDFDDIAAELNRELGSSVQRQTRGAEDSDTELMAFAKALVEEEATVPNRDHRPNEDVNKEQAPKEKNSPVSRGTTTVRSTASVLQGPRTGGEFPSRRSAFAGPSAIGQTTFSSTPVPVTRRANFAGVRSTQASDEFDVLGRGAAKRWRSIVHHDESRISRTAHGPLSRGYQYDVEPHRPLNDATALKIMEKGLEAASKDVPLTASEKNALQSILKEESTECLDFVESEIRSKLLNEDEFKIETYPSAASRFLGWADMPE